MPDDSPDKMHRVQTDPLFYAILGTIGGTYVILIIAMLVADGAYIFTSDMSKRVILDFSTDGEAKPLSTGDIIDHQFARYGLAISTHDPDSHPARIIDSDKPSAANSNLGTPNQAFGGAGVGRGGNAQTAGRNAMPLGNVIVIEGDSAAAEDDTAQQQWVANWVRPVRIERVRFQGMTGGGGEIVTYDENGLVINRHPVQPPILDELSTRGTSVTEIGDDGVARIDVTTSAMSATANVEYSLTSSMDVDLKEPGRKTVRIGGVRVVPEEAGRVRPLAGPGVLVFTWEDPVQFDELLVLDVNADEGYVVAYDLDGAQIAKRELDNLGPNGVERIGLATETIALAESEDDDKADQSTEPAAESDSADVAEPARSLDAPRPRVARLEVHLPNGGAVAQISFTWHGRIRDVWQREHPALARLFYNPITTALKKSEIQNSIRLTLISCTITAIVSLWVAIPIGYLMARHDFFGRNLIDAILDIPIVLPPLVVGLSLLILFQFFPVALREAVVYQVPAVILAQFAVACAFAVRTMRATFDHIDARHEQVALTLGLQPRTSIRHGRIARSETRRVDRRDAGLGSVARRVRSAADLCRDDTQQDGSAFDDRLPRAEHRRPGSRGSGLVDHGRGSGHRSCPGPRVGHS